LLGVLAGSLLAAASVPAAAEDAEVGVQRARPALGLFSSLPLYWGEAGQLSDLLGPEAPLSWARQAIERSYRLKPLDLLDEQRIAETERLLIAQPRILGPSENLALDQWVRRGGRLLLFADALFTGESRFGVGDPRRPQDVALLSPILARWGLELRFDESQPAGERAVELAPDIALPVDLAGQFGLLSSQEGDMCLVSADGLVAQCAIGAGQAVLVADAALLEDRPPATAERPAAALAYLLALAFSDQG